MVKLNGNQLKQLAEFSSNLSLVFFASIVTPVFSKIDKISIESVVSGGTLGFLYLTLSLSFLHFVKDKKI